MRLDDVGPYSIDTLRAAGAPQVFTTDARELARRYVAAFEAASGRTLYPMQVEMLQIETLAYAMAQLGLEGQIAIEEGLVAYASETGLEALGPNRSTPRLAAASARTTLRFALASARTRPTLISRGVRVSAGDEATTFLTLADAVIPAGALAIEAAGIAAVAGVAGNGLQPGQIATVLDPMAGVTVSNTTISSGGADQEDAEAYRLRLANAFERISAGSFAWYRERAMSVSSAIIDCAVIRPQPCYIDLYSLTADGAAGPELRAAVLAHFQLQEALDARYGDEVSVKVAAAVQAQPQLTVRYRGVDGAALQLAAIAAGNVLLADWRSRLAADVAPSAIEELVRRIPGVVDAEVTGLGFQKLAANSFLDAISFAAASVIVVPV